LNSTQSNCLAVLVFVVICHLQRASYVDKPIAVGKIHTVKLLNTLAVGD